MPGVGVGLVVLGYGMLYTMYQKTWGQGGSFLYWITGSARFPGPATAQKDTSGGVNPNTNPAAAGIQPLGGGRGATPLH